MSDISRQMATSTRAGRTGRPAKDQGQPKMAESNAQKLEKAKAIVLDSIVKVGVSTNQSQAIQRLANAYALLEGTVAPISGPHESAPKSA